MTIAGCSSAAPPFDEGGDGDTSGSSAPTSLSDPGDGGTGEPAPESTGGWDPSGGGGSTSGGGVEDPPSFDVPEPFDKLDSKEADDLATCDPEAKLNWRMALRDGDATSSPAQAREAVLGQWLSLTGVLIRPWEFLNYYSFPYPAGEPGALKVGGQMIHVEGDPDAVYALQLGVAAPALTDETRPKLHLTLALDNSGSMEGKALTLLRAACKALASKLRAGDTVSVVTWNLKNAALLEGHVVSGPDDPALLEKIDALVVGGSAELYNGLTAAYKLANATYVPGDINRVIVISDGGSVANEAELSLIAERAQTDPGAPGVSLIGVGVGDPGTYRAELVDAIATAGLGPALFIGSEGEAERQLQDRFLTTVVTAALDVAVRVELPAGLEFVRPELPESVVDDAPERVALAVNDSLVLQRRLRACGDAVDLQATMRVELQWTNPASGPSTVTWTELKLADMLAGDSGSLVKGEAVLAYAEALRAHQGLAADGEDAVARALMRVADAMALLPNDAELAEIAAVLSALQEEN